MRINNGPQPNLLAVPPIGICADLTDPIFFDCLAKVQVAFAHRLFDFVNIDFPHAISMKVDGKYDFIKY